VRRNWVWLIVLLATRCDTAALQPNGSATRLAFIAQPSNAAANQPLAPAIAVAIVDDSGSTIPDFVGAVTISLSATNAGATLSGSQTQIPFHGIATFPDLRIDLSGNGYTLVASAAGLDAVSSAAFDITCTTSCWTVKAPIPTRRTFAGSGVLDGQLYVVGGLGAQGRTASVEAYDPATNAWTTRAPLPTPRAELAVGVVNGILYAVGGSVSGADATGIVDAYDPTTNRWTTQRSMPGPRSALSVVVANGLLYAIGGTGQNGQDTTVVQAYDPGSNSWTTKASMQVARSAFGAAVVNDVIYVFGGDGTVSPLGSMEAYDPGSDHWSSKAPMLTPRSVLSGASANGFVYALGGRTNDVSSTVERYDPATNSWAARAPMPTARVLLSVGAVDGILYAIGGSSAGKPFLSTNEAFQE